MKWWFGTYIIFISCSTNGVLFHFRCTQWSDIRISLWIALWQIRWKHLQTNKIDNWNRMIHPFNDTDCHSSIRHVLEVSSLNWTTYLLLAWDTESDANHAPWKFLVSSFRLVFNVTQVLAKNLSNCYTQPCLVQSHSAWLSANSRADRKILAIITVLCWMYKRPYHTQYMTLTHTYQQ